MGLFNYCMAFQKTNAFTHFKKKHLYVITVISSISQIIYCVYSHQKMALKRAFKVLCSSGGDVVAYKVYCELDKATSLTVQEVSMLDAMTGRHLRQYMQIHFFLALKHGEHHLNTKIADSFVLFNFIASILCILKMLN